ncbi:hypothetical protein SLEP1_g50582 [Rubroshorea leprosula]|uniref:Uncharacterized protein n=1 Tax=Rubroshorea leprosula TaxID=152421 RepID=A0AAV5M0I0_9ROSI|nr:hypothetical protein SLEP1_g50582 [Rubroshorea leprosula]
MEMLPQPLFSSTFVCIITISILLLLPLSYSDPLDEFLKCNLSASFKCGSRGTLSYPFWSDKTPEDCHPLGIFQVEDCEEDAPTIDFGPDGSFLLQDANSADYTLTIASTYLKAYICPETPQNKTLQSPFLKFSQTNKILTLFYNCTPPQLVPPEDKINDCGPNEPFFLPGWGEPGNDDRYNCSTMEVTVNQTVFDRVQEGNLTLDDALRQFWFDVECNRDAVFCHQCESLGGKCESNWSPDQHLETKSCQHQGMDYLCKTICF